MEYLIKEVNYDDLDFKKLCVNLDKFQNEIIPWRTELEISALDGLEKLEKIILIYDCDNAIASAGLKPVNEITAEIARVYTDEKYRGKGLAKILINEIIEFAKESGYKKLVLDTWKDSVSARNLYRKMGFVEIPMFDIQTLKNSFSTNDEEKLKKIQESLVFMQKDIY
ncbi:MAG: GNAT family N-acetyltransferase [Clostridia bacterium]|nr:GNAT family N-acetyltransferase [Clostridia bacterium]